MATKDGRKTGGRKKGTPNKPKQALIEAIQAKFPNYHPVMAMAEIANDESLPVDMRFNAHKEVAQYIEPKRKAIEVDANVSGELEITSIERRIVRPGDTDR